MQVKHKLNRYSIELCTTENIRRKVCYTTCENDKCADGAMSYIQVSFIFSRQNYPRSLCFVTKQCMNIDVDRKLKILSGSEG